jgi:hypothetical protein
MRHAAVLRLALPLAALLACAEASAPLPPPLEAVLVLDRVDATLTLISVEAPLAPDTIQLPAGGEPTAVAARNEWALVTTGAGDAVHVVDLRARSVVRTIGLPAGSGAAGAALVDDSLAYVTNPGLNSVTRIDYLTGDTATVDVGTTPLAVVAARGRVFVMNANLAGGTPAGPSWVTVLDPLTNRPPTGTDSIGLPGPGGASDALLAADGIIYVLSRGPGDGVTGGRLSLVDPVGREELGSFGGFGSAPIAIAADPLDRLFVASPTEGLLVFDRLARQVVRGIGDGIAIPTLGGVAVDSRGRIYALETGPCTAGNKGQVHVLRRNLTTSRLLPAGSCPVDAVLTEIPPAP